MDCKSKDVGLIPTITSLIEVSMKNDIKKYKNPYVNQYVAPFGYHFQRGDINYGRVMWMSNVDGVTIEKDET